MEYEPMRQFADSWGLLYLFAVFIGACLYIMRPGAKKLADEAALIPFKENIAPTGNKNADKVSSKNAGLDKE